MKKILLILFTLLFFNAANAIGTGAGTSNSATNPKDTGNNNCNNNEPGTGNDDNATNPDNTGKDNGIKIKADH